MNGQNVRHHSKVDMGVESLAVGVEHESADQVIEATVKPSTTGWAEPLPATSCPPIARAGSTSARRSGRALCLARRLRCD